MAMVIMTVVIGTIATLVGASVRSKMIVASRSSDTETARQTLEMMSERLRNAVEEIVLADQVGLDVYGVGEHHRPDYAGSAPAVVLAAAAAMTKRIRLTSAVTVLS
ncbi:MAG: LLM class flavin-dependent oxidoreductase, partial [Firmicutes bacterium]|nr:LLM class flavin-dependent oxidoreductase [Bacillota bacterium]